MYVVLLTLACWCSSILVTSAEYYELDNAAKYFEDFIVKFDKKYKDEHEKLNRFEIFKANLEYINRLNEESDHAVFALTQFTDMTSAEFSNKYADIRRFGDDGEDNCTMLTDKDIDDVDAPESLDWRELHAVTRVKTQGECGSSWAFSAIGQLEGQQAIKHKKLLELSEQEILDCDQNSQGCAGGLPALAFKAAIKVGGVMLEKDYPYVSDKSTCRANLSKAVVKVTNCFTYNLTSQEKVKQLLYKIGPISIGIRANAVMFHKSGIITDKHCSHGKLNHAVLLVGYGTANNKPYWIFKNSWGPNHGEAGYYRMQRSENRNGACGMLNPGMATAAIA